MARLVLFDLLYLLVLARPLRRTERPQRSEAGKHEDQRNRDADISEPAAGAISHRNAPLGTEEPDAICKVPRSRDDPDYVEEKGPRDRHFTLHLAEGQEVSRNAISRAEQMWPQHAHGVNVPADVDEGDQAGPTLRGVHPVAGPRILGDVAFAAEPDVEAVNGVIEERNIDADPLEHLGEGKSGEELDLFGIGMRAIGGEGIGNEMLDQERPDRNDAAQRMQSPEKKGIALSGTQGRHSLANTSTGRSCHDEGLLEGSER